MKLGQRLRLIRKGHQLTLKDLSQISDLSVPYLSDMERGVVNPSIEALQKVAMAYNISVKELISDVEGLGELSYTNYPEEFQSFLNEYEAVYKIDGDWKELLSRINFRGKQPTSKTEWLELYLYLKRILSPKEDIIERKTMMNHMKKQVIELVQDVVNQYSSTTIPTIDEICRGLELDLKEGVLQNGIDGMNTGKTIIINSKVKSEERKRFTLFHEVTHYLIEREGDLISELHEYTFNQEDGFNKPLETLCNIGAAEFMMPSKEFTRLYEKNGLNVQLIPFAAKHFRSSTIAATIQLTQVAPNRCIAVICEKGLISNDKASLNTMLLAPENQSYNEPKLHVVYSASSPSANRWLAKYTVFPDDHIVNQAYSQTKILESESEIPFPSWKERCICQALYYRNRIYALFHLTPPPNPNQMSLI